MSDYNLTVKFKADDKSLDQALAKEQKNFERFSSGVKQSYDVLRQEFNSAILAQEANKLQDLSTGVNDLSANLSNVDMDFFSDQLAAMNQAAVGTGKVTGKVKELSNASNTAAKSIKNIEKNTGGFLATCGKIGGALMGWQIAYGWIDKLAGSFVRLGDSINKASLRTGMSATSLSGLKFAAEQSGGDMESLTTGMRGMQNTLGSKEADKKLGTIGLSSADLIGKSSEEQLYTIADALSKLSDKSKQARAAMEIFSEAGYKLLPMLQSGSAGIKDLQAEAERLGFTLNDASAQSAANMGDAMNRLQSSFGGCYNTLMSALTPSLTVLLNSITSAVASVSEFYKRNQMLVNGLGAFAAALLGVPALISAVTAGVGALSVAFAALAINPVVLGLAALAAGVAVVYTNLNNTATATRDYATAAESSRAGVDALNESEKGQIERLKELQGILNDDPYNAEAVIEATKLVNKLNGAYGDLGLSINTATGKIDGLTAADGRLAEVAKKRQLAAIDAQISEAKGNKKIAEIERDSAWTTSGAESANIKVQQYQDKISALNKERMTLDGTMERLKSDEVKEEEARAKAEADAAAAKEAAAAEAAKAREEAKKVLDSTSGQLDEFGFNDALGADGTSDALALHDRNANKELAVYDKAISAANTIGDTNKVAELTTAKAAHKTKLDGERKAITDKADAEAKAKQDADAEYIANNTPDAKMRGIQNAINQWQLELVKAQQAGDKTAEAKAQKNITGLEDIALSDRISRGQAELQQAGTALAAAQKAYNEAVNSPEKDATTIAAALKTLNDTQGRRDTAYSTLTAAEKERLDRVNKLKGAAGEASVEAGSMGGFNSFEFARSGGVSISQKQLDELQQIRETIINLDDNAAKFAVVGA